MHVLTIQHDLSMKDAQRSGFGLCWAGASNWLRTREEFAKWRRKLNEAIHRRDLRSAAAMKKECFVQNIEWAYYDACEIHWPSIWCSPFCCLQSYMEARNHANVLNALMVDSMHQVDLGIFAHVRDCIKNMFSLQDEKSLTKGSLSWSTHTFNDLTSKQ